MEIFCMSAQFQTWLEKMNPRGRVGSGDKLFYSQLFTMSIPSQIPKPPKGNFNTK